MFYTTVMVSTQNISLQKETRDFGQKIMSSGEIILSIAKDRFSD